MDPSEALDAADYEKIQADKLISDLVLVVNNKKYFAHRFLLAVKSPVFRAMLYGENWMEGGKQEVVLQEAPTSADVFPQFLKYFYNEKVTTTLKTVTAVIVLADKYGLVDLVKQCVEYMENFYPLASKSGQLINWLNMLNLFNPKYQALHDTIKNFIKWNFDSFVSSHDLTDLRRQDMHLLLQQNDLAVVSEYMLFGVVEKWLLQQQQKINADARYGAEQKTSIMENLVEEIMSNVRFTMMTPRQLAELLLSPIVLGHMRVLVVLMSIGMLYHSGQYERVEELCKQNCCRLQFTPRYYTNSEWCKDLTIRRFDCFQPFWCVENKTHTKMFIENIKENFLMHWNIEFFPRGVRFEPGLIRGAYNDFTVPECIIKTVRLRVTCIPGDTKPLHPELGHCSFVNAFEIPREMLHQHHLANRKNRELRFKVVVLLYGTINNIKHVMKVQERTEYLNESEKCINIDNILLGSELDTLHQNNSPFLLEDEMCKVALKVIILPYGPYTWHRSAKF